MEHISTRGWTLAGLLEQGERFHSVSRSSYTSDDLESQIKHHEESGTPFVIEGWHQHPRWPDKTFSVDFCRQYFRSRNEKINVRNVHTRQDKTMAFDDFVEKSHSIPTFAEPDETERLYGKDVECPQEWEEWLVKERVLPEKYLSEGSDDLFALRPKKNGRPDVETLMCYFGVGDTYTPCHKDLCASSGQNLMCFTEQGGSSFWFMTKSKDCVKVTRYFQSLKHELDHETHVISVSDLAKAPFDVFITEQKLGDLVLVPPRSCHQVVNFGGMTIKMSWSRMTLAGLSAAFYHELPMYRRVCRPEIYQIKSTIYYTLCDYTQKLADLASKPFDTIQKSVISKQLTTVLRIYDHILHEEYSRTRTIPSSSSKEDSKTRNSESNSKEVIQRLAEDMHTCDFCGADIFQSYFRCLGKRALSSGEDGFIVCPGCYVEGRTCTCQRMKQCERQSFDVLFDARWKALRALMDAGHSIRSFEGTASLHEQRRYFSKPCGRSIFHAATLLHAIRENERQPTKSCRVKGESHAIHSSWTLNCKKCHSARCYQHLSEGSRMHSMRALLLHEQDNTTVIYHEQHLKKFPEYHEGRKRLLASQMDGSAYPDFNVLMHHNSITFPVCQPVNPKHASLGWYDRLPRNHRIPKAGKRADTSTSMDVDSDGELATTRSSGGDSQRSMKNNAYVEVDQPTKRRRVSGPKLHLSSPLSSASEGHSDRDELVSDPSDSDDDKKKPARPSTSKRKLESQPESSSVPVRGVKKPPIANPSNKRLHESRQGNETDNSVFAPVYPVGPPTKRRRQEREQRKKDPGYPSSGEIAKTEEPNAFATSLGAAINQVAATATRNTGGNSSPQGPQRKSESVKPRPMGTASLSRPQPPPQAIASSSSQGGQSKHQTPQQAPILVNVADLQDMVVKTADRVVREMIGDVPNVLLAAHAAVSMMTGYVAHGQFMNNNTQLQFPSTSHFAEASTLGNSSQVQGSSSSSRQPRPPTTTSSAVSIKDSKDHQQVSKDGTVRPRHRMIAEGRPSSALRPEKIGKSSSGESSRQRRVEDSDEEEEV